MDVGWTFPSPLEVSILCFFFVYPKDVYFFIQAYVRILMKDTILSEGLVFSFEMVVLIIFTGAVNDTISCYGCSSYFTSSPLGSPGGHSNEQNHIASSNPTCNYQPFCNVHISDNFFGLRTMN